METAERVAPESRVKTGIRGIPAELRRIALQIQPEPLVAMAVPTPALKLLMGIKGVMEETWSPVEIRELQVPGMVPAEVLHRNLEIHPRRDPRRHVTETPAMREIRRKI